MIEHFQEVPFPENTIYLSCLKIELSIRKIHQESFIFPVLSGRIESCLSRQV
jgi:hypothetical protein